MGKERECESVGKERWPKGVSVRHKGREGKAERESEGRDIRKEGRRQNRAVEEGTREGERGEGEIVDRSHWRGTTVSTGDGFVEHFVRAKRR